MSRIIVKNLPKHITERRFHSHFADRGEVTDVKLVYTKEGKFRRFGYIGYRTEEDAQAAQAYFNNTFIDTSRVEVEVAKPRGDATLPRAWSVHTEGTSLFNRAHGVQRERSRPPAHEKHQTTQRAIRTLYNELLRGKQDDPRFKEFLQVMAPRAKNKTWTNDDYASWHTDELAAISGAVTARREQIESAATKKKKEKKQSKTAQKEPPAAAAAAAEDATPAETDAPSEEPAAAPLSDMEWLRQHMSAKAEFDGLNAADSAEKGAAEKGAAEEGAIKEDPPDKELPDAPTTAVAAAIAQITETGRLFVRNLPYMATEEDLRAAFETFGPLTEVHMPISKDTKRPKGFAHVLFLLPEHAVRAYKALDNTVFLGRLLHVLPGKDKPQAREQQGDALGGFQSSVKQERDAKKKALATSSFNWNSLYMSADAVADSISARLNIAKADLLSADSAGNPAVRLALAETHIISDAKSYFESHGVCLDRFGDSSERSDVVILVKNIPFSVDEAELRALFGRHGSLGRVLLPPSRTIAIVEFLEPTEARAAFRHLAYKRLKDAPIYLERAPRDVFDAPYDPSVHAAASDEAPAAKPLHDPVSTADVASVAVQSVSQTGCVLFVKNLGFDTTEDTLRRVFGGVDGLASVVIRRKKDAKNPGRLQSMGFGFVEYRSAAAARQALESFQGVLVDDRALELKMSDRLGKAAGDDAAAATAAATGDRRPKGTKLVVKNVPFEATRKDIRDLVSAFGQIKSVRLPKKFSGGHRGFAFVECLTPQEAQNVLDTMKSTHLYGRHLVLGWAEEDNSIQAIREKVGRQFAKDSSADAPQKRRKILMDQARGSDESDMNMDEDDDDDDDD
ncbi:Multiple RNA-binding domain-containing protein 1 [Coemansia javaensis]|uniref:Multiple RNA-binding domain-containing protein 1 n=1 Tax=Coemansia javaensis TaxID=2761396 RepID=A0A9W8HE74_9FUNG|nr:Multiple RNA-binding domain-containing protein 1 [Coemansia javaensis]